MNWRPKDWKNPFTTETYSLPNKAAKEYAFEAGADAMLEYLLGQEHQNWLATPAGELVGGKWVFIPDEK